MEEQPEISSIKTAKRKVKINQYVTGVLTMKNNGGLLEVSDDYIHIHKKPS